MGSASYSGDDMEVGQALSVAGREAPLTSGQVGLRNMGNTCFMNAGLQCLSHLEPLTSFFLTGRYKEDINKDNPQGSGGKLAEAFADLLQALWQSEETCIEPSDVLKHLRDAAPHLFDGYEQQDVQEFLAFCLDTLHEDLNRVVSSGPNLAPSSEQREKEEEKATKEKGEEFAAALAWARYLEKGASFLVDLFQGQLRSTLTCQECKFQKRHFEPFLYLSLPVESDGSMSLVEQALEKYLETEVLTEDEKWQCPTCCCKVDADKKIDLWKLPPVLVLHLKRFEFDPSNMSFKKIETLLSAPLTIDLSKHVSSPQRDHATYDVVAVASHRGAFGAGHYTACCKVASSAEAGAAPSWYCFNDDYIVEIPPEEVISEDAYVIFLVRRAGKGRLIRRQTLSLPEVWPHCVSRSNSAMLDFLPKDVTRSDAEVEQVLTKMRTNTSAFGTTPGTVELESTGLCLTRMHLKQKSQGSEPPLTFSYVGYSIPPKRLPEGAVEVRFSVVGGSHVCAVDRGIPELRWVRVCEESSTCYPYKEEIFYYEPHEDTVKYTLQGPAWSCYVCRVSINGAEDPGTATDVPVETEDVDPTGDMRIFALLADKHIPFGAQGLVVGPVLGPSGEPGYLRVRFRDSTWDLESGNLLPLPEEGTIKRTTIQRQNLTYDVVLRSDEAVPTNAGEIEDGWPCGACWDQEDYRGSSACCLGR